MILIILDGLGDTGKKTPLSEAKKPHLDALAQKGETGFFWSVAKGVVPGSDTAHMSMFGYLDDYPGRGVLEALGIGITPKSNAVYFRGNVAHVEGTAVKDRRAGRPSTAQTTEAIREISGMEFYGITFNVYAAGGHRVVVEALGEGVHPIPDLDTHKEGRIHLPEGKDKMAMAVRRFLTEVHKRLGERQINWILLRGASVYKPVPTVTERYHIRMGAVTGGSLYTGVARYLGMETFKIGTGDASTPLEKKFKKAQQLSKYYDAVFLHVKATDIFGHDGDFEGKKKFIEKVDAHIPILDGPLAITGDHSTPVALKRHSSHPVPLLITESGRSDKGGFDEKHALKGGLRLVGKELFLYLLDIAGHPQMVGT